MVPKQRAGAILHPTGNLRGQSRRGKRQEQGGRHTIVKGGSGTREVHNLARLAGGAWARAHLRPRPGSSTAEP
eukprot:1190946-Prorocentrum_minimum.AAC.2